VVAISLENLIATVAMIDTLSEIANAFPSAGRRGCGGDGFPVPRSISVEIVVLPLSPMPLRTDESSHDRVDDSQAKNPGKVLDIQKGNKGR
jgi:hypothetical protein